MSLRSGTQKYGDLENLEEAVSSAYYDSEFKGGLNPLHWVRGQLPSWWQIVDLSHDTPPGGIYANGHQQQNYTKQDALEFCRIVINMITSLNALNLYRGMEKRGDPGDFKQYANQLEKEINTNQAPAYWQLTSYPQYYKINTNGFPPVMEQYYENIGYLDGQENVITGFPQGIQYASAEEDPSIYQSDEVVTVTPGQLTWYYVKKPSGVCERLNVSQNFVDRMTSQGWIFSLTDICKTDVKCPARVRIINIETNQASGDGYFNCDTIERYTENPRYRVEYYDGVTPTPTLTPPTTPTPTPTPTVVYPLSANVKISFTSNIGGFSSSIPIADVSQLQILSNESNEWRYTLIGSSTNQPLMTLSGLINKINNQISVVATPQPPIQPPIEEEPITTDHVEPPEMPVEEPPMVTVTPTEPSQVNWIPEPFFSFINNVFRK